MGGIVHTAYDTVEDLRRNLRDRYKDCHSVLKELLQNADDAGATELHIAWIEGLVAAEHPLLRGPTLLIVNNGPFSYRDSYAIHLAGTGSKGHEEGKIGKFGLGLKSVFHLCEAFFYVSDALGDDEQVDAKLKEFGRTGILNPWYGARYPRWDSFSLQDQAKLRNRAVSLIGNQNGRWFGICLPLRKQEHCRQAGGDDPAEWAIEPRYYGDEVDGEGARPPEDIFSHRRIASLRQMLPLMSTLKQVRFWRAAATDTAAPVLLAEVTRDATHHADWRTMKVGRATMAGAIDVAGDGKDLHQTYAGVQELLAHDGLTGLTARGDWPRMDSQTDSGRKRAPAAVKQHASVVVMEQHGEGSLRVDRAVFLPLGDPPHPECQGDGKFNFELMLHGYFFVDAGRLGVDFAPENEQPTVRQEWNRTLYQEGTLPLVIPAMAEYARVIDGQPDAGIRLRLLTALLTHGNSHLWRDYQSHICRDSIWCCRLLSGRGQWEPAPKGLPLILLPGDEQTDPALPFAVFPALAPRANGLVLSLADLPRLATATDSTWPEGFARQMLESVPLAEVVSDEAKLSYLVRSCDYLQRQDRERYLPDLIGLLRRLLREIPLADLRKRQEQITALLQLLPTGRTLPVPFKADLVRESERVFQALVDQDTDVLPVPDIFLGPQAAGTRTVATQDARLLLEALSVLRPAGVQEEAFHTLVGQALLAVIAAWRPGPNHLLEEFGDLPLFYARDFSCDRRILLSARQLQAGRATGLVFAGSATLCKRLQGCLEEGHVLFLAQPEIVRLLALALGPIPACDAVGCASLLSGKPKLAADVSPRVEFLRGMLPAYADNTIPKLREALRYVLHGQQNETDQNLALYLDGDSPWCMLAHCILAGSKQAWRMIPRALFADITQSQADRLNLRQCGPSSVPALLDNLDGPSLDSSPIARRIDWRDQIIREWPEEAKPSLKTLRIYTCSDGTLTSITDQTFIQGALPRPPASVFANLVLIIDANGAIEARKLAPTLSPEDILLTVLALADCHQHWRFILDSIPEKASDDLRKALRQAKWVPAPDGTGCSPSALICREGLGVHVRRMREAGRDLVHKEDLPQDLLKHARLQVVEDLGPHGEELYRRLGEALRDLPGFAAGENAVQEGSLATFIDLFGQDDADDVMPTAALFRVLQEGGTGGVQWIARHMLPAVKHSLEANRVTRVLTHLARRHEASTGPDRRHLLDFFNSYLLEGIRQPAFHGYLSELRFLSQDNHWCHPSELALRGDNIASGNLVHLSHAQAFAAAGFNSRPAQTANDNIIVGVRFDPQALAASAGILGSYLNTWSCDDVPNDAMAAVVSMLGNHDGFPKLYEQLRDTRSLRAMRGMFAWHVAGPGWGLQQLMDKQHFCIVPADAKTVTATNLLGTSFNASVSTRITSLFDGFDGRSYFAMPIDERCYLIRLRQITPEELSSEERLAVLGNTVQAVRSLIHRQGDEDFQTIWSQITHVGQLDIDIAQEMILESSAMLLETQLSIRQSPKLRKLFTEWHQVRQRAMTATTDEDRREADKDRREVLESLRQTLLKDSPTQTLLVSEVRKRLEAASYEAASIPFELFQNGDDAVVELESLCPDADLLERARPAGLRSRFVAAVASVGGKNVLRFIHWGRGINQFRIGGSDGKNRGFDRDMERMLVLQGSGKDDTDENEKRTGKFGLGFKSVFFVSDTPCVLSGSRSRFRVLAGVYPDRLSDADEKRLEGALEEEGDPAHKGTVVELTLREPQDADAALGRFMELAGYLVVFARRIRECSVGQPDRPGLACKWSPDSILPGIEAGEVQVGPGSRQHVLVFRLGADAYGAVLLPLGQRGVCQKGLARVPEVWVTTPTRHEGAGRLLVNGPFDLNPGRTQLRKTDDNVRLAETMGQELGEQFCRLYHEAGADWDRLRNRIGCQQGSWAEFWLSLWDACVPYADVDSVLHGILFGSEHCGMHRLICEADALPSGLPGRYACLTSLPNIRWRTKGFLAEEEVWSAAAQTGWVGQHVLPGAVIAQAVATVLDQFCEPQARDLTIASILKGAVTDGPCVPPDLAAELGRLIFAERMRDMASDRRWAKEEPEIREILGVLKFRTAVGDWAAAASLLVGHAPAGRQEENRRAGFAPRERLLAADYGEDALRFFLACRKEMQASAEQMAQWIREADNLAARTAGLEYLERGELSYMVRLKMLEAPDLLNGTWLRDRAARAEAMVDMDADRRAAVLGMLGMADEIETPPPPPPPPPPRSPGVILRDISDWWQDTRDEIVACHDRAIYPQGHLPRLAFFASAAQLQSDIAVRKEWLVLLMLGSMHRIGRVTTHQNRGFLDLCEERGWIDVLADKTDDPVPWFKVMDDYLESLQGDATYFHWMNQFLAYYQLSRWLPSYARAFEAVTRPQVNLSDLGSITDIANLRTSHVFAGSTGFDAPPCSRVLGLGSHFILRETIRVRVAQGNGEYRVSQQLEPMAFVPSQAVRTLLAQILSGGDASDLADSAFLASDGVAREQASKTIARALRKHLKERATFDGSFDVPLLVLAWGKFPAELATFLGRDAGQGGEDPLDFLGDSQESEDNEE